MRRRPSRRQRRGDRGRGRQSLTPRNRATSGGRRAPNPRQATPEAPLWRGVDRPGGVGALWQAWQHGARHPGGPASGLALSDQVRTGHLRETPVMDGCRAADRFRVPRKPSNTGRPQGTGGGGGGQGAGHGERGPASQGPDTAPGSPVTCAQPRTAGPCGCLHVRPEAGARCGSATRRDLCGGHRVTGVPTATATSAEEKRHTIL